MILLVHMNTCVLEIPSTSKCWMILEIQFGGTTAFGLACWGAAPPACLILY
jgi:hypothetical protein